MTTTGPTIEVEPDAVPDRPLPGPGRALDESAADRCSATGSATSGTGCARSSPRRSPMRRPRIDRTHTFAPQQLPALAAAGAGRLIFPRRWGGTEDSNVAYAAAMEEISAAAPRRASCT